MRQLREAQQGNAHELRALLEPHVDGVWSIVSAMLPETDALAAIGSFQENLRTEVRQFALDQPFGIQLYGALWTHLSIRLDIHTPRSVDEVEPSPPTGIPTSMPRQASAKPIHQLLQEVPPFARLVFVFQLVTGLTSLRLSALTGARESVIRKSRAGVFYHLHGARSR